LGKIASESVYNINLLYDSHAFNISLRFMQYQLA
jgi:hypothetical protein